LSLFETADVHAPKTHAIARVFRVDPLAADLAELHARLPHGSSGWYARTTWVCDKMTFTMPDARPPGPHCLTALEELGARKCTGTPEKARALMTGSLMIELSHPQNLADTIQPCLFHLGAIHSSRPSGWPSVVRGHHAEIPLESSPPWPGHQAPTRDPPGQPERPSLSTRAS
jgi:hypothetical protein